MASTRTHTDEGAAEEHVRLDELAFLVLESGNEEADVLKRVTELFPAYTPEDSRYDHVVTPFLLECYAGKRSQGLTIPDAAHAAGISGAMVASLLRGEGLGLDKFAKLARAEVFASSLFVATHLGNLEEAATQGAKDWKASVALLEKVMPSRYGKKVQLDADVSNGAPTLSADNCEKRALTARKRLAKLRKDRAK